MALSKELTETVQSIIKEMGLNDQFEKLFLKHLEKESNFQADKEDRLDVINLLRNELNKKVE
tara:strand:+ start:417 stop:602 length:186 start_codon:yes stop_codon:yes gene_type:complete